MKPTTSLAWPVADDVAQPGGDLRVLVADIAAQPVDLGRQLLDAQQVREVAGDHPFDDQQDALVLVGEVPGAQAVEADDGDHLVIADDGDGDLALDHLGDLPVEAARAFLFGGVRHQVGSPGEGHVAGQAALLRR
jgi:hypothetical protein